MSIIRKTSRAAFKKSALNSASAFSAARAARARSSAICSSRFARPRLIAASLRASGVVPLRGGDDASVPPLVPPSPLFMFMEDDFRTCEGALRGLRYLVQKTRTVYPEWLGLRTSYGLNGVVVRSEDLPGFRDYLLRHQARLPPDLLWTEWVEGTRADVRERTNARKLIVYRYNLFEHLGAVSTFSIRPRRPSWPGCYAPMSSAWSLTAVEKFDERRCAFAFGELLSFPVKVRDLTRDAVLVVTVMGEDRRIVASASSPFFDASAPGSTRGAFFDVSSTV